MKIKNVNTTKIMLKIFFRDPIYIKFFTSQKNIYQIVLKNF